jgi:hypothetical protein
MMKLDVQTASFRDAARIITSNSAKNLARIKERVSSHEFRG